MVSVYKLYIGTEDNSYKRVYDVIFKIIGGLYLMTTLMIVSVTLEDKYRCDDLKMSGKTVISELRVGYMLIPYNRCVVMYEGEYIKLYKFDRLVRE